MRRSPDGSLPDDELGGNDEVGSREAQWQGARRVIRLDGDLSLAGCSTSIISVTLYTTPGRHADEGTVCAAIVAALDRRFSGVDAVRVAIEQQSDGARPHPRA